MKPTKRIAPPPDFYTSHNISTKAPPKDALFWTLWNACTDTAEKALKTDFIQGIKAGDLSPDHYGSYTVMDAYYCFEGADDYKAVSQRAEDPALKALLDHKYQSYHSYNNYFHTTWGLKDAASINPNDAVKAYAALESKVCQTEDPIYTLIVMLPCEHLWYWLSDKIKDHVNGNLYGFWIKGNLDPKGAYAMGNALESYRQKYPDRVDESKALDYYQQAMNGEYQDFAAKVGG